MIAAKRFTAKKRGLDLWLLLIESSRVFAAKSVGKKRQQMSLHYAAIIQFVLQVKQETVSPCHDNVGRNSFTTILDKTWNTQNRFGWGENKAVSFQPVCNERNKKKK